MKAKFRCKHTNAKAGRAQGCYHCTQTANLRDVNEAIDIKWKKEGRCFKCGDIHKGDCPKATNAN